MKKNFLVSIFILILVFTSNVAFAAKQLRNPQGRIGNSYKTERYNPVYKTNITQNELADIVNCSKQAEKNKIKAQQDKQRQLEEQQKQELARQKAEQQAALKAEQDKQRQLEEQQKQELARQKAEQQAVLKAEQDKQKAIEEQQKQELARQKAEQQAALKAEQDKQKAVEEQQKQELARQKAEQQAVLKAKQDKQRQLEEQQKQELARQKAEQQAVLKAEREQQKAIEEQKKLEENKLEVLENSEEEIAKAKETAIKTKLIEKPQPPKEEKNPKIKFLKNIFKKPIEQDEKNKFTDKQQNSEITTEQQNKNDEIANKIYKQDAVTKAIVKEISDEILAERPQMLDELSLLWVSAVQKSDTVYFAIIKLSNPNGEEVNKTGVKKILQPILSAAPLVGQAFVNPALSAGSLIGTNVMGTMMNDSATKRLTKVNDADLVILARAIDELQETLLMNYLAYKGALKEYELSIKIADSRKATYEKLNEENSPDVILANTFYTEALDNQYKARQEFLMKRVVLEQMVGADALNEMENKTADTKNKTEEE